MYRKGQAKIMEYLIMAVFLLIIILIMILFIGWWNVQQLKQEEQRLLNNRVISLAKLAGTSQYTSVDEWVLEDAKLSAMLIEGGCEMFENFFGKGTFAEIKILGHTQINCTKDTSALPECNYWKFCNPDSKASKLVMNFPVNVYRKETETHDFAMLRVGVFT